MEITNKYHRTETIYNWKQRGVIYSDYDDLYDTYINTMNCQHCGKEFVNKRDRNLDHDHQTGEFRLIVCHKCNSCDSYIKYPTGYSYKQYHKEYYETNKDYFKDESKIWYQKNKERLRQKNKCECGGKFITCHRLTHEKTKRHMKWVDDNM